MLILLPPSETKRPDGSGAPLDLAKLRLPSLEPQRRAALDALVALSADESETARVLKLSPRQLGEVATNAALWASPTMPAMDRYTGVLFDALDAESLSESARSWLAEHVLIHSAPFGLVGAADAIPSYRLGAGVRLPGLTPMKKHWNEAVTTALAAEQAPFVLDLRSEAYVALGSVPAGTPSAFVRVVTRGEGGEVRALNHFNKHAKGALVRVLAESEPVLSSAADLLDWAAQHGVELTAGEHEWQLVTG
ncbi:YaaA family protein [Microbacterium sp. YY-03]|uniref:YaaA family protein n=1 Tax=Microbacterium sp. YY-03 TaxID=3421636 RepID=UPI003D16F986